MSNRIPAEVFPPGEFIQDELDERGWTQADLAQIMGRPVSVVNLIIAGKRGVTAETACELASAFGTSPEFWLNLENAHKLSKVDAPQDEIRKRAALFESAPVTEMQRRGWINKVDNTVDLKRELDEFYADYDLEEFKMAARASTEQGEVTAEQIAWCVRALKLAKNIPVKPYAENKVAPCIANLRTLAAYPEEVRKVPRVLAEAGIRLVIVEHLPRTKIDGAALWLRNDWKDPVIVLSVRYDRIDWFWHTLGHEISHIRNKDACAVIDNNLVGEEGRSEAIPDIEKRANAEAAEMLIPKEKLDSFIVRKRPYFSKELIIQFAHSVRIHPGIVAGQLQHRKEIKYSANREMLVKIRDILTAEALTDGWGHNITGEK